MAYNIYADPSANPVQSYDLHTPFGIRPGQVTPAEELRQQQLHSQSGIAAQMMAQNNAADLRDQQMRALRESLGVGGGGGGEMAAPGAGMGGGESYADRQNRMAQDRMFGMANARDLARISSGVPELGSDMDMMDRRAMQELGQTNTHNELLRQQQEQASLEELGKLYGAFGGSGVPGAAQIPNAPASGDLKFMTPEGANILVGNSGGGANSQAPAGGGISPLQQRIRDFATLEAARNHQQLPDFAQQDLAAQREKSRLENENIMAQLQLERAKSDEAARRAQAQFDAGNFPEAQRLAGASDVPLKRPKAIDMMSDPFVHDQLSSLESTIANNNWSLDPAAQDRVMRKYNDIITAASQRGMDPVQIQQLQRMVKQAIDDSLYKTGTFFETRGAQAMRDRLGM